LAKNWNFGQKLKFRIKAEIVDNKIICWSKTEVFDKIWSFFFRYLRRLPDSHTCCELEGRVHCMVDFRPFCPNSDYKSSVNQVNCKRRFVFCITTCLLYFSIPHVPDIILITWLSGSCGKLITLLQISHQPFLLHSLHYIGYVT